MRFWSTQAREAARHYEHKEIGYNYRMSNISAGIGRAQLQVLDERIVAKKEINNRYKEGLKDLPISMMPILNQAYPNYWLSVITLDENSSVAPDHIISALENENIESRPVWKPMHMQPVFSEAPFFQHKDFNYGEKLFKRGVCLPSGSLLSEEQQGLVIQTIASLYQKVKQ